MKRSPHFPAPPIVVLTLSALMACYVTLVHRCHAQDFLALETRDVRIMFEASLAPAAKEIAAIYPAVRATLETTFGWRLIPQPTVLLVRDSRRLYYQGLNPLIAAFAVPKSRSIVMDCTRVSRRPFTLENTLKHEMCHLLLHEHIPAHRLPRWLDEGICQWASDGISEIGMDPKQSRLTRAVLRDRVIPLHALQKDFPQNSDDLLLAYAQSKSFIAHIISRYHKAGILSLLDRLKRGETVEQAALNALAIPLDDLEQQWRHVLRQRATWFTLLSTYLYEILFGLMALVSIFAFIKIILKKRAYMAEEPRDRLP